MVRELGCQLTHGYGMTEVPMITMGDPRDTPENLATTEGRPPAGMSVRVTAPDGTPLPAGRDGEVRLRGEAVCRGYLDPGQNTGAFDADGYLITGDLGHLTGSGHLVLTGRSKDVIIRKGENISAKEIEDLLHQLPGITDVAVIGLPDPARGERVCAVVEQPADAGPLTLERLTAHLRAQGLSPTNSPSSWSWWTPCPATTPCARCSSTSSASGSRNSRVSRGRWDPRGRWGRRAGRGGGRGGHASGASTPQ
ncbi:hypothetical protein GCM10020254_48250 [Streptomyces goshikiensis]